MIAQLNGNDFLPAPSVAVRNYVIRYNNIRTLEYITRASISLTSLVSVYYSMLEHRWR